MFQARVHGRDVVIAGRLRAAHTHWTRLRGLLGTRSLPADEGLWLRPCRQVHMLGMRYAVDAVFLDDALRVVHAIAGLAPGKVSPKIPQASSVIELPTGALERTGLTVGDRLEITGEPEPGSAWLDAAGAVALNLLLAGHYGLFAWAHLQRALERDEWATTLPIVIQEALLVVLFLTRRRSLESSSRPFDWVIGIGGTFLPLLMRANEVGTLVWLGRPVQMAGLVLVTLAIGGLGRSIGIVAANRGIKTSGLYRAVRHPLYTAHLVAYLGYVISYPSVRNVVIVLATTLALGVRASVEERLLSEDPTYRDYLGRIRWRFVPYVY